MSMLYLGMVEATTTLFIQLSGLDLILTFPVAMGMSVMLVSSSLVLSAASLAAVYAKISHSSTDVRFSTCVQGK